MTEQSHQLMVRCFFCRQPVLEISCEKVFIRTVVNTSPLIRKEEEVNRCFDCRAKSKKEAK